MKLASDILKRARTIIQDETNARWSLLELCDWLNDGLLVTATHKPSAFSRTAQLSMSRGVLQVLPSMYSRLLSVTRNVRTGASGRDPRRSITIVAQALLDAHNPAWHDEYSVRYQSQVKHVIVDEANPRQFHVYPGNDGTGVIEAVVSAIPMAVAYTGAPDKLESYRVSYGLDETYGPALLMYVLYAAYMKDAQHVGNANRAVACFQQYTNLLGIELAATAATSPNAKAGIGQSAAGVAS